MSATVFYRHGWIKKKDDKHIGDIGEAWPRLFDVQGMIGADFKQLYGESEEKLFQLWPKHAPHIITYVKHSKPKLLSAYNLDDMNTDQKENITLLFLPHILPPVLYKEGKKTTRLSQAEISNAFIDIQPVGTNIPHYLSTANPTGRQAKLVVLGSIDSRSQVFVIIGTQYVLEMDTLQQGVDTCFKCFWLLDISYPKMCAQVWEFFGHAVYSLAMKSPSVSVKSIASAITSQCNASLE
ncbi:PREDICTED: uncharacterized protein LOC106809224 [Priapulus caudatus]|uniref:Uncharacterized protein LOC106809224 n=1 Tax=Priapulus caudatus TaxID=37621 RepID=A0ABM1E6C9_PRICU|nr:PREDICTED: uncharacterized protein LOC106809224 [Priapulus caudatus]